jgi:hypothetical protein
LWLFLQLVNDSAFFKQKDNKIVIRNEIEKKATKYEFVNEKKCYKTSFNKVYLELRAM